MLLSLIGLLAGLARREAAALLALVWLAGIVEFSMLGLLEENFPALMEPLLKYDYPFSLAWHGPIIPYTILGGFGLAWLAGRLRLDGVVRALAIPLAVVVLALIVGGVAYFDPLLELSKDTPVNFFGAFSSEADVAAMEWLRENTPPDVRVLNHPGPHEGDWVPVISERDTVYFRPQPFFQGTDEIEQTQAALRDFWRNPTDPENAELLRAAGVQFVIVPQVFGNPDSFEDMLRWRDPLDEAREYAAAQVAEADYLLLVYEQDGAQVYALRPASAVTGQ